MFVMSYVCDVWIKKFEQKIVLIQSSWSARADIFGARTGTRVNLTLKPEEILFFLKIYCENTQK
jgi:hypothetical protein